ncbi:outer membrane-stress sensor serine endopeptidase DegS [Alteromonas sp. KC3]|uniref:trypsin-like peptidase domain-containing protein n=1 Tax=unclassified Alteromonas TaxID=2614992 RepID=UPI0019209284|nr:MULTISPECIES: trypsin-like peptidase domain-containing protein [unclassified Alteromonas]BCO17873.1 outer membrane-stress sensor serine endopeptidase DegS [Alteromonas sp. KC3]BCO21834.1 outer membrane-stress sensor serine endopeptidase DegS [Alteromonas sp. KC14]
MIGRSTLNFILKSIFLGITVAVLLLLFLPDLRQGNGLATSWFATPSVSANRESYFGALSRSAPAVVNIYSVSIENDTGLFRNQPRERTSLGSGVIMTENGYILTCHHVVQDADSIYVAVQDGRVLEAQIVGTDPLTDLAVLKVTADNLHIIPQVSEPDTHVGDVVMAIGNPFDLGQTITQGIVSRAGRNGLSNYVDFIQTDAVLNQGNSGGALVDSNGILLGITNANFQVRDSRNRVRNVDGINFAVPYELAKRVMDEIISNGRVIRGQLGFIGSENRNRPGIDVTAVAKGSPADLAGLQPGDIIVAIDGVQLESASKTLDMIAETTPGTELDIEISRDGRSLSIKATVAELRTNQ